MNDTQKRRMLSRSRFRKQFIRRYLFSFVVTAVVASVAIVIGLKSPTAAFLEVSSFGKDVYYQVVISDDDAQIRDQSLKIIAENQLESHEVLLTVGEQTGYFSTLSPDTDYTIKIVADRGFGAELLASTKVKTANGFAGRILESIPHTPSSSEMGTQYLSYLVTTAYNDVEGELESVTLKYAYLFEYELEMTSYPYEAAFVSIAVVNPMQECLIEPIPNQEVTVFLVLEAQLVGGGSVVLDAIQFKTPLVFHTSLYIDDAGSDYLGLTFYPDYERVSGTTYSILLKNTSGDLIQRLDIDPVMKVGQESITIRFDDLAVLTEYRMELEITYVDPITAVTTTILYLTMRAMTTLVNTFDVTSTELPNQIEMQISAVAPPGFFLNPSYVVYSNENGQEIYLYRVWFELTEDIDGVFRATLTIDKPLMPNYLIKIYVDKNVNIEFVYYQSTVYEFFGTN